LSTQSKRRAEFSDFGFFRFHTADSYYVGGFGEMGWL
jgi:hypothetical protein